MSFDLTTGKEIDEREDWQKEWTGMPEFNAVYKKEYAVVIVRCAEEKDFVDFCKLVGQDIKNVPNKTNSIWYPKKDKSISLESFM